MNTKLISLLATICLASVLIIGAEWGFSIWAQKSTLESLTATESKSTQDEIPHIDLDKQTEESYADLVARPLFIKGRRPVEEVSVDEAQATAVAVVFEWQLNGIFTTKKGLSAFLSKTTAKNNKDKYKKVAKDAELDGWQLTEIYPDKVIFTQAGQQKELLLRKIKAKDPFKKTNVQNTPNVPSPEDSQAPEEVETESTNE